MIGLLDGLKLAAGALIGAVAVFLYTQVISLPAARSEARERLIAEQAVEAQRQELERKGDDAKLQRMSDYDLCRAYLGGVPECASLKLRGVCEDEHVPGRDRCPFEG